MNYLLKHTFILFSIAILGNSLCLETPMTTEYSDPIISTLTTFSDPIDTTKLILLDESALNFLQTKPMPNDDDLPDVNVDYRQLDTITGETGFNSKNQTFGLFDCFKSPKIVKGSSKAYGSFSSSLSRQEILNQLNVGLNVTIGLKNVTGSANLGYSQMFEENSSTSSFYYFTKFTRTRNFRYDPLAEECLTPSGLKLLEKCKTNKNFDVFYKRCGNMLPKIVEEGGVVIVQVSVNFKSSNDKKRFDANVGLNYNVDVVTVKANLDKTMEKLKVDGKTIFKAKQFGGDAQKFNMMFPDDKSEKCADAITPTKRKENPNAASECMAFLNTISNYLRTDFSAQFNGDSERYYVFGYETFYHDDLELF